MQQKISSSHAAARPALVIMDEPSPASSVNAVLLQDTLVDEKAGKPSSLHPSHGPGREALRRHLPHRPRPPCSPAACARSNRATSATASHRLRRRQRLLQHAIAEYKDYSGHVEIKLKPHADAQSLLHAAAEKAKIYKFELVEPSLEGIFIATVGEKIDA